MTLVKLVQDTNVSSIIDRNYEQNINKFNAVLIDIRIKMPE